MPEDEHASYMRSKLKAENDDLGNLADRIQNALAKKGAATAEELASVHAEVQPKLTDIVQKNKSMSPLIKPPAAKAKGKAKSKGKAKAC
eukprot:15485870-Alexandrium_andersonii.AAC.3